MLRALTAAVPSQLRGLLRSLIVAQRHRILAGLLCSAGAAAVGAAYAYLTGPLLQTLLSGGDRGPSVFRALVPPALHWPWDRAGGFVAVALVLVLLALVKGTLNLLQTALLEGAHHRMGHQLRRHVYGRLLAQPLAAHRRFAVGDLLTRFLDDTGRVQQALIEAPLTLVREGLAALALLGVALVLAPWLAAIAVIAVPMIGLAVARLSRRVRGASLQAQSSVGQLGARAQQALAGLRDVKASDAVNRELFQLSGISQRLARWSARRAVLRALSPLVNEVTAAAAIGLTIFCVGTLQARRALDPAQLVSFFAAILLMYRPIKGISNAMQLVAASGASADRLVEMLQSDSGGAIDSAEAAESEEGASDAPAPLARQVQLRDVCFGYPGQEPLLDRLSLSIAVGEIVALAGRSGSGKSTVVDLLCGLELADAGELLWDGRSLNRCQCRMLPRQVGLVSQRPLLFDGSVAQNLRYGNPDANERQLWQALDAVGLRAEISALPAGLETALGGGGRGLSVGQAQRLVIARALLRRVRLLLLDEPASALDPEATAQLAATLVSLRQECAILLVSHRQSLLRCATRVVSLEVGAVGASSMVAESAGVDSVSVPAELTSGAPDAFRSRVLG